mmetsp:Transcript_26934/g.42261  ORF Transcript_26934/g.42261 Transcript_26934/m.42261 type:complete len:385 (+) Transcript_26934:72-1226(+)
MKVIAIFLCILGAVAAFQAPTPLHGPQFNSKSTLMKMEEESPKFDFKKAIGTAAISFSLLAGALSAVPQDVEAAQSGGRVGGNSFSSPSRSSAPRYSPSSSRLQAAPTVMPVPVPVAPMYSPFGFSPFGGFGMGISPFGFGFGFRPMINPIDLIVFGAVAWGVLQLVRGVSSSGDWGSLDDEGYSSLGAGVSVFKIQLALNCANRGADSLLGDLQRVATSSDTSSRAGLSSVVQETALCLLRRSAEWEAAASTVEYFGSRDADKAEGAFNRIAVAERSKLEKETFGNVNGMSLNNQSQNPRGVDQPTLAVVTIALAIRGETLKGFNQVSSLTDVKKALQALAADVTTDMGDNVLATELLWTPEDPAETMTKQDLIMDFPELIDL